MTTHTTFSPSPASSSSATARVPILLTFAFWCALAALLIFSPSLVDDVIGVSGIVASFAVSLLGYGLRVEASDRRGHQTVPRVGHRHRHVPHALGSRVAH